MRVDRNDSPRLVFGDALSRQLRFLYPHGVAERDSDWYRIAVPIEHALRYTLADGDALDGPAVSFVPSYGCFCVFARYRPKPDCARDGVYGDGGACWWRGR